MKGGTKMKIKSKVPAVDNNLYVHNADQQKEFTKVGFWTRLRLRVFSAAFLTNVIWKIFRFVLLIGISYIIIFPFFTKISSSFFSPSDFTDSAVKLIPKDPTLAIYKAVIVENDYIDRLLNTVTLSLFVALVQTFITAIIGYGFAKFKFKGRGIVFALVILTMVVPQETLSYSMFSKFKYFDIYGIIEGVKGLFGVETTFPGIQLTDTHWPLFILSATGLGFKNGLYIFIFRQFYKGVPDELEEAAYVDGSGIFKTYFRIILPLTVPMMVTVFMFSFSWSWTDTFYSKLLYSTQKSTEVIKLLPGLIDIPASLQSTTAVAQELYNSAVYNAAGLLVILPLFIIFLFAQNALVEGIERSGIVG